MLSRREEASGSHFGVKLILTLSVLMAAGLTFASRYRIGLDLQQETSLPYRLYLITSQDRKMQRGAFYAFSAYGLAPIYPDGTRMIKQLVGLPGDEVRIDAQNRITVNGIQMAQGLPLAKGLQSSAHHFQGHAVLSAGHYWFLGQHPRSLDSRYFGAVTGDQIIGRAYAVF